MSEQGERGKTGDTGQVGETGRAGGVGETGQKGQTGERGPVGDHGQHGDPGFKGDTGAQGERGRTGLQGESTILSRKITVSFLLVTVVAFVLVAGLAYVITQNSNAIDRVCIATNEGRAINNRDRLTLLRGAREAETNAENVADPTLKKLLLASVRNTRREVALRPYLEKLPGCKTPVPFPPRDLPKETP